MEQNQPASSSSQIREEEFELNGKKFYRTSFFDISCIRCENGYYNFTKIAQDNGKRDIYEITRYKYWKEYIDEFKKKYRIEIKTMKITSTKYQTVNSRSGEFMDITDEKLSFTIRNQEGNRACLNGVYMPKLLLHFFCEHVNKAYAMDIMDLIDLIEEETRLRNITLEQKIEEQAALVESLKTRLQNSNAGFNHETPGAIIIHETKTHNFKLFYKVVNVRSNDYPNDTVISYVYNIDKMKRLINFYTKKGYVDGLKLIGPSVFEGTLETITKLIDELQHFKFQPSYDIDEEIKKYVDLNREALRDKSKRNGVIGTLFEFYCAKRFSIPMYKLATTEMLSFSKQDHGVDLIDIDKMTIAQCKYYQSSELTEHRLQTFIDFCKYMDEWNRLLIINVNINLSASVVRAAHQGLFDFVYIENYEFEGFLRSLGLKDEEFSLTKTEERESSSQTPKSTCSINKTESLEIEPITEAPSLSIDECKNESSHRTLASVHESAIREYVKEQLESNDYLFLDELIAKINEIREENASFMRELPSPMNTKTFYKRFGDLYEHENSGSLPKIDGRAIVRKQRNKEAEIEFITSTIGDGEIELGEYIALHNARFGTNYNRQSFTHRFRNMFRMQGHSLYSRRIESKKVSILQLRDESSSNSESSTDVSETASNDEIVNYFNRELRAHDYLDVNETISYIREHFDPSFSVRDIHTTYKSLFAHDTSGGLTKRQGKRVLVLNVDKEAEIEFIRANVADEPSLDEYIILHNAHFGTNYTSKTFTHRFCNLFQMQGRSLCYRQVNSVRIPILRLL